MRLITNIDLKETYFSESVVTIGNFDGVHKGHVELFRRLTEQSRKLGCASVVVTFEPHPLTVLAPEAAPVMISTFEQKHALIAQAGVDCLVIIDFTREFSQVTAEDFVRNILCSCLSMRHIIIGHDYAFGRDRQGNYDTLMTLGQEIGFSLEDMNPVGVGETVFSSSLARRLISEGKVSEASAVLGRYHLVAGKVVHGREIGRKLGFPTANIATLNELCPSDGIYAVMVIVRDLAIMGACNIGSNPTFCGSERSIEVFLLNFSDQIYDEELSLFFVERIRDVRKFPDSQSLISAIEDDVMSVRSILDNVNHAYIKPVVISGAS